VRAETRRRQGEHPRYGATQGIRIAVAAAMFRAEASDGRRALVVQGLIPNEAPPWPGFKELPDDAFETIVLPRDLERACKLLATWATTSSWVRLIRVGEPNLPRSTCCRPLLLDYPRANRPNDLQSLYWRTLIPVLLVWANCAPTWASSTRPARCPPADRGLGTAGGSAATAPGVGPAAEGESLAGLSACSRRGAAEDRGNHTGVVGPI
jgi:hypothetical protein